MRSAGLRTSSFPWSCRTKQARRKGNKSWKSYLPGPPLSSVDGSFWKRLLLALSVAPLHASGSLSPNWAAFSSFNRRKCAQTHCSLICLGWLTSMGGLPVSEEGRRGEKECVCVCPPPIKFGKILFRVDKHFRSLVFWLCFPFLGSLFSR